MNCVTIERIMTIITKHCLIDYMNRMNGDNDTTVDAKKKEPTKGSSIVIILECSSFQRYAQSMTIHQVQNVPSRCHRTNRFMDRLNHIKKLSWKCLSLVKKRDVSTDLWNLLSVFFSPHPHSLPPSLYGHAHWLSIDANRPLDRPVWLLKKRKTMNE